MLSVTYLLTLQANIHLAEPNALSDFQFVAVVTHSTNIIAFISQVVTNDKICIPLAAVVSPLF